MTGLDFSGLMAKNTEIEKRIRKNKKARNAMKKATRKIKKAIKADTAEQMKILLGMAQVAVSKAQTIARLNK